MSCIIPQLLCLGLNNEETLGRLSGLPARQRQKAVSKLLRAVRKDGIEDVRSNLASGNPALSYPSAGHDDIRALSANAMLEEQTRLFEGVLTGEGSTLDEALLGKIRGSVGENVSLLTFSDEEEAELIAKGVDPTMLKREQAKVVRSSNTARQESSINMRLSGIYNALDPNDPNVRAMLEADARTNMQEGTIVTRDMNSTAQQYFRTETGQQELMEIARRNGIKGEKAMADWAEAAGTIDMTGANIEDMDAEFNKRVNANALGIATDRDVQEFKKVQALEKMASAYQGNALRTFIIKEKNVINKEEV